MPLDDVATRRLWEIAEANGDKPVACYGDDSPASSAPVVVLHRTSEHPWVRRFQRNVALDRIVLRRRAPIGVRRSAPRQSRPRQTHRVTRAGSSRDGPSRSDDGDSEPPPEHDLGRLAAVSVRLWAHGMRRLAHQKVAG
jgi:hypothetical protein